MLDYQHLSIINKLIFMCVFLSVPTTMICRPSTVSRSQQATSLSEYMEMCAVRCGESESERKPGGGGSVPVSQRRGIALTCGQGQAAGSVNVPH